jgi:hypothetical protein
LTKVLHFCIEHHKKRSELGIVLATEGHTELVDFCMKNAAGWTEQVEAEMILAASFLGNADIVSLLLDSSSHSFCLDIQYRYYDAMLGACAAGRKNDLQQLATESNDFLPDCDSIRNRPSYSRDETEEESTSAGSIISNSLVGSAIHGYVTEVHSDVSTISFLVNNLKYTHADIMYALELVLAVIQCHMNEAQCILRLIELISLLSKELGFEPIQHHAQMKVLISLINDCTERIYSTSNLPELFFPRILEWLESLINSIDIQDLKDPDYYLNREFSKEFYSAISALKEKQREYWVQFDGIKKGQPLLEIQHAIESGNLSLEGYDRGGLRLIHLAGKSFPWSTSLQPNESNGLFFSKHLMTGLTC